jgi:hypothetical protein
MMPPGFRVDAIFRSRLCILRAKSIHLYFQCRSAFNLCFLFGVSVQSGEERKKNCACSADSRVYLRDSRHRRHPRHCDFNPGNCDQGHDRTSSSDWDRGPNPDKKAAIRPIVDSSVCCIECDHRDPSTPLRRAHHCTNNWITTKQNPLCADGNPVSVVEKPTGEQGFTSRYGVHWIIRLPDRGSFKLCALASSPSIIAGVKFKISEALNFAIRQRNTVDARDRVQLPTTAPRCGAIFSTPSIDIGRAPLSTVRRPAAEWFTAASSARAL